MRVDEVGFKLSKKNETEKIYHIILYVFLVILLSAFIMLTPHKVMAELTLSSNVYTINTIIAGNGTHGYSGDGDSAFAAQLYGPSDIAIDSLGNFYIADTCNDRIRFVDGATGKITTIAGNGREGYSGDGGAATAAQLNYPAGVAVDSTGNIYIADYHNNRIRMVDKATGIISTIAGTGVAGYSGDGGAATSAQLYYPHHVALDPIGNIYIADEGNNRICMIDKATGIIKTVVGNGTSGYSGDGGSAIDAQLKCPSSVTLDSTGNIFIADTLNNVIRKVDRVTGQIATIAGIGVHGYSGDGGPATAAQLFYPDSVAFDSASNIYIADSQNDRIRMVDNFTGKITTIAGNGRAGYSGDGGIATAAEMYLPKGIVTDTKGKIYVADKGYLVRVISNISLASAPVLTAVNANNIIRQPVNLTFTDDTTWRSAIYGISVDGIGLNSSEYTVSSGNINIAAKVFTTVGNHTIVVKATGYCDASVIQRIVIPSAAPLLSVPTEGIPFGQSMNVTFSDDPVWRSAITGITVDGNLLNSSQYTVGPGNINIAGSVFTTTGSHIIAVQATGYNNASEIQNILALTPPVLTASTNNNIIGQPVNLIFADDPVWRANITGITANGNDLSPSQFTVAASNISLAADAFPTVGDFKILVKATGYNDTIVNLTMLPATVYTINTFSGTGVAGYSGDGGTATAAQLNNPGGIAIDNSGNVYFADIGNSCIRMVNKESGIVSTIAGNGTNGYSGDGGIATTAQLNSPVDVAIDSIGDIYIDDWGNNRIRMINKVTGIITTVAGNGTPGYSGDGGVATAAQLMYPCGVTIDNTGNIYIADSRNRIRMVNKDTGIITTVAGNGTNGYSGDGGTATAAQLNCQENTSVFTASPLGVKIDSIGDLYITDKYNNRIRKVTKASNIITTIAGTGAQFYSGDGGTAITAQLNDPSDVTIDNEGNIYIADTANHCIRMINKTTGIITTIAGAGFAEGYSGDGEVAIATQLNSLNSIAVDGSGNIYISDPEYNRIRKLSVTSKLTAPALTAGINNIVGHTVDITFTDDADWRGAINGIIIDGTALNSNQYIAKAGNINISAGVLTKIGNHTIVVKATGYFDSKVTLNMSPVLVKMVASNPSTTGFTITLDSALPELTTGNFTLLDSSNKPVTIISATASDNGETYVISAVLSDGTYTVSVVDSGYTFDSPQFVLISIASLIPPALDVTLSAGGNNLSFTDDSAWRSLITKVTYDGTVLDSSRYTVTAGKINFNYMSFTSVGTHTFVISATGYRDATAMLINSIDYNSTAIADFDVTLNSMYSDNPTEYVRKHPTYTSAVFGDNKGIEPISFWFTETADGEYYCRFSTAEMQCPLDGSLMKFVPVVPGKVVIKIYSKPRANKTDLAGINLIFHNYSDLVPLVQISGDDAALPRVRSITSNKGQYYPGGFASPPALTADTKNNTVGQSINLSFPDDIAWRAAISKISLDGNELKTCPYSITAGNINIAAGILTSAGDHTITIKAMGYNDTTITQTMAAAQSLLTATSVVKVGTNPDNTNSVGIIVGLQNITDSKGSASSSPSLQGYKAEIDFDPLKVSILNVNALTSLGNFQVDRQNGKIIVSDSTSSSAIQTDIDKLFFVSLDLIGTVKDSTSVAIKFSSATDQNGNGITIMQPVTLNFQRGKIANDGTTQISISDAVAGLQYLAKLQDESQINVVNMASIIPVMANTNCIKPSVKDIIVLMQKFVGLRDDSFNLMDGL